MTDSTQQASRPCVDCGGQAMPPIRLPFVGESHVPRRCEACDIVFEAALTQGQARRRMDERARRQKQSIARALQDVCTQRELHILRRDSTTQGPKVHPVAADFAARIHDLDCPWMYIHGPSSRATLRAAQSVCVKIAIDHVARLKRAPKMELVDERTLLQCLREDHLPTRYIEAHVLVLADIGRVVPNDWRVDQICQILTARERHGRPTVITSTHPPKALACAPVCLDADTLEGVFGMVRAHTLEVRP